MAIAIMMISTLQVVLWGEGGNLGQPGSSTSLKYIGNFILWMGNLLLWGYFDSFLKPQGPINPNNHHHDVGHSSVSGFSVRSQSTKAWVCYSSGFGWLSSLSFQSQIKQPTSLYSNEEKSIQATTPVLSSEAARCWTQSATASESKVNSTHSHCHSHYVLFLTLEVPPHPPASPNGQLVIFRQNPASTNCIHQHNDPSSRPVPPKPPSIRVHRVTSNSISLRSAFSFIYKWGS